MIGPARVFVVLSASAAFGSLVHAQDILSFTKEVLISGLDDPVLVEAVDLDGDGDLDLIIGDNSYPGISWHENLGTQPPTFQSHALTTNRFSSVNEARPTSLFIADIDGDNDLDLGYSCSTFVVDFQIPGGYIGNTLGLLEWYENLGGTPPTFQPRVIEFDNHAEGSDGVWVSPPGWPPVLPDAPFYAYRTIATDADNDGDIDLTVAILFTGATGAGQNNGVIRYVNNGAQPPGWTVITVKAPDGFDPGDVPASLIGADIDNDGTIESLHMDNDTVEDNMARITVIDTAFISKFDTFTVAADFQRQVRSQLAVADIDQDGWKDAVTVVDFAGQQRMSWHDAPGSWPAPAGPPQGSFIRRPIVNENMFRVSDLVAEDLTGDSYPEIVRITPSDLPFALTVFQSNGAATPTFTQRIVSQRAASVEDAEIADLTGDTLPDIILAARGEDAILMFRQDEVENTTAVSTHPSLAAGISAASPGDRLKVGEGRFTAEPVINPAGKALTIVSDRDAILPAGGSIAMPNGSALEAAPGRDIRILGAANLAAGATATMTADRVAIGASGSLSVPASATLDTSASVEIFGDLSMGPGATIDSTTTGEIAVNPVPTLIERRIDQPFAGDPQGGRAIYVGNFDDDDIVESISVTSDGYSEFRYYPGADNLDWIHLGGLNVTMLTQPIDIDGNGLPDLVGRLPDESPFVSFQTAPLTYSTQSIGPALAGQIKRADVGDVDGDGDLDIVVLSSLSREIWWYESDGAATPSFTPILLYSDPDTPSAEVAAGELADLVLADIDGDSDIDAVVSSNTDVRYHENLGGTPPVFTTRFVGGLNWTSYGQPANNPVGGNPPAELGIIVAIGFFNVLPRIDVADMNNDGSLDIVLARGVDHRLSWFENGGGPVPVWTETIIDNAQSNIFDVETVDLDKDGDADILTATNPARLTWFEHLGTTPPEFAEHVINDTDRAPGNFVDLTTVTAADADGDGSLEIFESYDGVGSDLFPGPNTGGGNRYRPVETTINMSTGSSIEAAAGDTRIARGVLDADDGQLVGSVIVDVIGTLAGTPTVTGSLDNRGRVTPDDGTTLPISADYLQSGALDIDLTTFAAGGSSTKLGVVQNAALGGGLLVSTGTPLNPVVFSSVDILTASDLVPGARFDVALLPTLGSENFLSVVYNEGSLGLGRAGASVSLAVTPLGGDVEIDPLSTADSGTSGVPQGAILADIDVDGDPDLLIALPDATNPLTATGSVVILYNIDDGNTANGWEGFGPTTQIFSGVGVNPSSVAVGEIDNDAQPDILVANRGNPANLAPDTASVLLVTNPNPGTFALSATHTFSVGDQPVDIATFDLDSDGAIDIVTANVMASSISVGFNTGTGVGAGWGSIDQLEELDLPEEDDCPLSIRPGTTGALTLLATANSGTNSMGLVQIESDRTITVLANLPADSGPTEVVIADFNLDGRDDVATVNTTASSISIALNESVGTTLAFGNSVTLEIAGASPPASITAGDLDNDSNGDPDIAVLAGGVVKIFRNDLSGGQLAFTPIPDQLVGAESLLVRAADLNGDGKDDVVTISESTGAKAAPRVANISILLATPPPTCAGDIDGDGDTDVFDFGVFAPAFGKSLGEPGYVAAADLDNSNTIDVFDFGIFAPDFSCTP